MSFSPCIWMQMVYSQEYINDNVGKFESRAYEGVILDYSTFSRACDVFNKVSQEVKESINVKF